MTRSAFSLFIAFLLMTAAAPAFAAAATADPVPERKPQRVATITPASRAEAPECAFTGKRIVALLSRDDVVAATEFRQFYDAFDCPSLHLAAAFGCAVDVPEGLDEPAADRVERCWNSPSSRPLVPAATADAPASAAAEGASAEDAAAPAQ